MSLAIQAESRPTLQRPTDRPARLLVLLANGAFAAAATLLVLLHVVPAWGGNLNPLTAMLSEYAMTPGRWLWDLSLVLTSLGSIAVGFALHRTNVLCGRVAPVFLAVWCVSVLGVAVFTKDPQGGAVTITGKMHLYATGIACAALPIAGLALARRYRTHPEWRGPAVWTRWLALASIPFFLPFIVPFTVHVVFGLDGFPSPATGLIERLMSALELAQLALLGRWARQAAPVVG